MTWLIAGLFLAAVTVVFVVTLTGGAAVLFTGALLSKLRFPYCPKVFQTPYESQGKVACDASYTVSKLPKQGAVISCLP